MTDTPRTRPNYFKYKVLEDPELASRLGHSSWLAYLRSSCGQCSSGSSRCFKTTAFLITSLGYLLRATAPWVLACTEACTMLLLYLLITPHRPRHFRFTSSLDDVALFSAIRVVAVFLAYLWGAGRKHHRPYWHTAISFCLMGFPFIAVKLAVFHNPTRAAPLALFLVSLGFSLLHVLAAAEVKRWAKKRLELGLDGYGFPWQVAAISSAASNHRGLVQWLEAVPDQLQPAATEQQPNNIQDGEMEQLPSRRQQCMGTLGPHVSVQPVRKDQEPFALAEDDSLFVACGDLTVHYKEALPQAAEARQDTAVVLVHSFGGGSFSWRLVMQSLADRCGQRVIALDRPGFGLTSRPQPGAWRFGEPSPYSQLGQAYLILQLCDALGIQQVTLVGHSDGCLPVVMAVAAARTPGKAAWHTGIVRSRSASEAHTEGHQGATGADDLTQLPLLAQCGTFQAMKLRALQAPSSQHVGRPRSDRVRHRSMEAPLLHSLSEQARLGTFAWVGPQGSAWAEAPSSPWPDEETGACAPRPQVVAVVLCNPALAGEARSALSRLLGSTRVGRRLMRALLHNEVGLVSHRRAWATPNKPHPSLLALYRLPHRVQNWDGALVQACQGMEPPSQASLQAALQALPAQHTLIVTGAQDRIAPHSAELARQLPGSSRFVVPSCGHLPNEERPDLLVACLADYLGPAQSRLD